MILSSFYNMIVAFKRYPVRIPATVAWVVHGRSCSWCGSEHFRMNNARQGLQPIDNAR
jgi:hypothetical protein